MNHEFLLEIGTEEIPAGYIEPALQYMRESMDRKLKELSLSFDSIKTAATPRRLTLCVSGLCVRQPDRREEVLGPPKKAAFDQENKPTKAAMGFVSSRNASLDDIRIVTTPKGEYLMLVQEHTGENTADLLSRLLPEFILSIPFAKSMRWSGFRTSFARPIQWLLALFAGKVVDFSINNLSAGNSTRGHRFMAPQQIPVENYGHYIETLRAHHVIVDIRERRELVEKEVVRAAAESGGRIVADSELLDTITNLVEFPVGIKGSFDEKFLALPREVLITSMRVHQKYFTVADGSGSLMPNFVAVNNTRIAEVSTAAAGHERVLRARLEDALFFFKEDKQKKLEDRLTELSGVVFQAQLGSMFEKTVRLEKLTAFLCREIAPAVEETAVRAARLAKADLVTGMVGEFPTLQGVMGKYYALHEGESSEVAEAVQEHYLPVRAESALPVNIAGALVSIADRIDTIAGCFGIGKIPTGTTDPYGLRRHALALLHIISAHSFPLSLSACVSEALDLYGDKLTEDRQKTTKGVIDFIKGRCMNDLIAKGMAQEAVDAVLTTTFDDVVDCRKRIDALISISTRETFTLLAGAFKRVINIIKDHAQVDVSPPLLLEEAERRLYDVYVEVRAKVEPLVREKRYEEALEKILEMKEPVDSFFDTVMVMSEDDKLRNNRLSLLAAIAQLFLRIGDFSRMYTLTGNE
ncbi:MAG: glycine--tRNA ligase subunit beta [Deltaproteobacteria bacterium]|nr:glycine--tRNA ligase subunit beta [Deltaproteobacteria bacterium]